MAFCHEISPQLYPPICHERIFHVFTTKSFQKIPQKSQVSHNNRHFNQKYTKYERHLPFQKKFSKTFRILSYRSPVRIRSGTPFRKKKTSHFEAVLFFLFQFLLQFFYYVHKDVINIGDASFAFLNPQFS